MFCIKCGKEIPDESNYCLYCGILLPGKSANNLIKTNEGKTLVVINCNKRFGWGKYKIKIFIDGNHVKDIQNGSSISFEIENGKHIVFCDAIWCKKSDVIEIIANSNEINFFVEFPSLSSYDDYKLSLIKTKETEANTWE
ncbi:MAG: zinc ribbon domain-containing protein [Treponema sp.]|jgi:hypothetical protein|nr:zinc ribbon domain-containing protein [Treponema sp.]